MAHVQVTFYFDKLPTTIRQYDTRELADAAASEWRALSEFNTATVETIDEENDRLIASMRY